MGTDEQNHLIVGGDLNLKSADPVDILIGLLNRSSCAVQVAAILVDNYGIHQWGWNNMGFDGMGQCAERHCLSRANPKRLSESTLYVAAKRRRNGRVVTARPCLKCAQIVCKVGRTVYRDSNGEWKRYV